MTNEQHLLTILAEECAEVGQRATKAIRFGLEDPAGAQPGFSSNKKRLLEEINDLLAVVNLLFGEDYINNNQQKLKKIKIEKYTQLSKKLGQL
jgi:NTP pyrophosphatase (non-canonical NTP hydrolase)|tara:strand:- start:135 stop:413 length:279 start_codon:yes stop_codon:yes gene_type:complete